APDVVSMDGAYIKANANQNKPIQKVIPQTARHDEKRLIYEKRLMEEVDQDRETHRGKPFEYKRKSYI
ncbi:MAG: hypothetical protein RR482_03760, partial [Clostridia bacterium]